MTPLAQYSRELEALVQSAVGGVVGVEHRRGQGSGITLAEDGYVVTNAHVVERVEAEVFVCTTDERKKARVVGTDAQTDLAVLKVDAVLPAALTLSDKPPRVGQVVMAIGDPFRFERSLSLGIISAVERSLADGRRRRFEGLIQTDAAINPGNSGGPLIDAEGRVVGVNTAVLPFARGLGFAIPASTVSWIVAVLIQKGSIERPLLGIAARGEALPRALQDGPRRRALRVYSVMDDSVARAAGLKKGDFVLSINQNPVASVDDLQRSLVLGSPRTAELEIMDASGAARRATVPLGTAKRAA